MSGRIARAFSLIVLALGLAACGGSGDEPTTTFDTDTTITETTETTGTTTQETTRLRVYFLLDGKVQPVAREAQTTGVAGEALFALGAGPTPTERELGMSSEVPINVKSYAIKDGVAYVSFEVTLTQPALAQTVYTLTQFPTVKSVDVGGKRYSRADMEDYTPAILVESPLAFETVASPLRVTGTANTFEATFHYDLTDPEGLIVDSSFVTATSGSGQRGTFDFTTKPYEVPRDGLGALIVYERSAKDGSKIHLIEIPLRMER